MSIPELVSALMKHAEHKAVECDIPEQNRDSYVAGYLSGELEDALAACPAEYVQQVETTLAKLTKGGVA